MSLATDPTPVRPPHFKAGPPDNNDDFQNGFVKGDTLIDTVNNKAYTCVVDTNGNAQWEGAAAISVHDIAGAFHNSSGDAGDLVFDDGAGGLTSAQLAAERTAYLVGTAGAAKYTSVQAAINAASSGNTVWIMGGVYFENVTLKDGVDVRAIHSYRDNKNSVRILGNISLPSGGTDCTVTGIWVFDLASASALNTSAATAASTIILQDCLLDSIDAPAITITSSNVAVQARSCVCNRQYTASTGPCVSIVGGLVTMDNSRISAGDPNTIGTDISGGGGLFVQGTDDLNDVLFDNVTVSGGSNNRLILSNVRMDKNATDHVTIIGSMASSDVWYHDAVDSNTGEPISVGGANASQFKETPTATAGDLRQNDGDRWGNVAASTIVAGNPPQAHSASHENGGSDEVDVGGLSGLLADPQTPATHASSHQDGGADEVSTATPSANQIPKSDGSSTLDGWISDASTIAKGKVELATDGESAASLAVQANDSRLSDARTPTPHASSHKDGGSDEVAQETAAAGAIPKATAATGKLDISFIPDSVIGGMIYQGVWDASTNTPTLADGTGTNGHYYNVTPGGTQDLGSGPITFTAGDRVVHNGTIWQKWDTKDQVTSVHGRIGDVVGASGDYDASQVDNDSVVGGASVKDALDTLDAGKADASHAAQHQNGGGDEVATATPGANAIPKADIGGKLDSWVSNATTSIKGKVELATDGESAAGVVVQGNDARLSDSRDPNAHASSHENGGSDEISVAGLSGELADDQPPKDHASDHQNGGSDEISVAGLSGLLADPQTPLAHASSHSDGGADEINVKNLAADSTAGQLPISKANGSIQMVDYYIVKTTDDLEAIIAAGGSDKLYILDDGTHTKTDKLSIAVSDITVRGSKEAVLDITVNDDAIDIGASGVVLEGFSIDADIADGSAVVKFADGTDRSGSALRNLSANIENAYGRFVEKSGANRLDDVTIEGCLVTGNVLDGILLEPSVVSSGLVIRDNTIVSDYDYAVSAIRLANLDSLIVEGNRGANGLGDGIVLAGVTNAGVSDNVMFGFGGNVVRISASALRASEKIHQGDNVGDTKDWTPAEIVSELWLDAADEETVTAVEGELGVLDVSELNPVTGKPWQVGDQYRLMFSSSTLRDAQSSDIADYDSHVQSAATAVGGLGTGWKAIGSTGSVDADEHTETEVGVDDDVPVLMMDGKSVIAHNYTEFWNGKRSTTASNIADENGLFNQNYVTTGSWATWEPNWTGTSGSGQANNPLGGATVNLGLCSTTASNAQWVARAGDTNVTETKRIYGISPVLTVQAVSGDKVSKWWDKSGNDRHVVQDTESEKPVTGALTQNSLNVIGFDPTTDDQFLEHDNPTGLPTGSFDLYMVMKRDVTSVAAYAFTMDGTGSAQLRGNRFADYSFDGSNDAAGSFNTGGNSGDTDTHILNWRIDGSDAFLFLDGVQIDTDNITTPITIDDYIRIGADAFGNNGHDGFIAEVLWVTYQTDLQRQLIEGYLAWKWGIADVLPADHQYKFGRPVIAPRPWTPEDSQSTLQRWWDFSDESTITDTGGLVDQVDDKSIAGDDLTGSGGNRPTTGTRTIGGLNAIDFDDASSEQLALGPTLDIVGMEVWSVFELDDLSGTPASQLIMGAGGNSQVGVNPSTTNLRLWRGINPWNPGDNRSTEHVAANVPIVAAWIADKDFKKYSLNGERETTVDAYKGPGWPFPVDYVGRGQFAYMDGIIGEIVVIDSQSEQDRDRMEGYLHHKFNQTGLLPDDHPYKAAQPMVAGAVVPRSQSHTYAQREGGRFGLSPTNARSPFTVEDMFRIVYDAQTGERGTQMRLVNDTGAISKKGDVIAASASVDSAVDQVVADTPNAIGVIAENDIPDGELVWVWMPGSLCQVLLEDGTAATVGYWVKVSDNDDGRADATNATPPGGTINALEDHLSEIGHAAESQSSGTDVLCLIHLHFN